MKRQISAVFLSLLLSLLPVLSSSAVREDEKFNPLEKLVKAIHTKNVQEVKDVLRKNKIANVQMIESKGVK